MARLAASPGAMVQFDPLCRMFCVPVTSLPASWPCPSTTHCCLRRCTSSCAPSASTATIFACRRKRHASLPSRCGPLSLLILILILILIKDINSCILIIILNGGEGKGGVPVVEGALHVLYKQKYIFDIFPPQCF